MNLGRWAILLQAVQTTGGTRNSIRCGSLGTRIGTRDHWLSPRRTSDFPGLRDTEQRERERERAKSLACLLARRLGLFFSTVKGERASPLPARGRALGLQSQCAPARGEGACALSLDRAEEES